MFYFVINCNHVKCARNYFEFSYITCMTINRKLTKPILNDHSSTEEGSFIMRNLHNLFPSYLSSQAVRKVNSERVFTTCMLNDVFIYLFIYLFFFFFKRATSKK